MPYDFDLSGLVNTGYARPDPSLEISRVTIRRYRGYCISPDAVRDALREIMAKQQDILDVLNNVPGLNEKTVNTGTKYLNRFFAQGGNEQRLLARFERACL